MSHPAPGWECVRKVAVLVEVPELSLIVRAQHIVEGENIVEAGLRHDRRPQRLALSLIEPVNGIHDRMGEREIHLHRNM